MFRKRNRNSLNSANLGNLINWAKLKDPVSHMRLLGAVVASFSLIQEVAGWRYLGYVNALNCNYCNLDRILYSIEFPSVLK